MKSGNNEGKQMDPLFPRLHLGSAERGGPRAPPRNKMALCEQLSVPSPKFNPGSPSLLSLPSSSSSLGPSSSSSRDNSYRRSFFSSFHSIHDSMHVAAARLNHQSGGTTASQRIKMTNHQMVYCRGHLNSSGLTSPSARNSRTYYVKKLVDEDDYTVPTLFQPGNTSNCVEGQQKAEKENLTPSKQLCHSTSLQQECRLLAETMTTRKRSASTMEGLSVSRSSLGDDHDQNHNESETADECREKQDCGYTPVGAEKKDDITNTSTPGLRMSPDAVVELFGQKQFWKARRTIIHQQRVFAQQVFELHRLIMVQRTIASSPEVFFEDNFYSGRKERTPLITKPRVDLQKSCTTFAFTAGNTVKRSPLLSNDADNHISNYKPIPLLYPPLSTAMHLPPGNQWLVPVRSPSEGLVYKPYTGPCPPSASLLAPYGSCGPVSITPAPGNFLTPLGQTYIPPYVVPMIKPSSHSAVETAISVARAPSNAAHGNFITIPYKTNISSHKKGTISGCTPNLQGLKETSNSQGNTASCKDELPLFPTAPTVEATSDQPSRSKRDDRSVKVIKKRRARGRQSSRSRKIGKEGGVIAHGLLSYIQYHAKPISSSSCTSVIEGRADMAAFATSAHQTCIPLPSDSGADGRHPDHQALLSLVPIHIVTHESQLPTAFLYPSSETQMIVGFDCEGVDLCRYGKLCIMQFAFPDAIYIVDAIRGGESLMAACKPALESSYITKVIHDCKRDSEALYFQYGIKLHNIVDTQLAYYLIEEQQGQKRTSDAYISFVSLLADHRYCGISYVEKKEVRTLLREDPNFWTYRPLSEMMVRAATDDVRFLPYVYHKMMEILNEISLWKLAVRGALYCRSFCVNDTEYADWPSIPSIPDTLKKKGGAPEEEILSVLDVPSGKMGCVIGRKGYSIKLIKESCNAEIVIGGSKGPPDKVIIIGAVKQVRKAEAMVRGTLLGN